MASSLLLLVPLLASVAIMANAWTYNGIDTSTTTQISTAQFTTLQSAGYIVFYGTYYNGGSVTDPNSLTGLAVGVNYNMDLSIKNARNISLGPHIDAIHIPKYAASRSLAYPGVFTSTTNIYAQARKPIDYLNVANGTIGRTWIYISQNVGSGWSNNQANNRAFLTQFLSYFPRPLGPQPGILTNQTHFQSIFGTTYVPPADTNGNSVPLFWINCPNSGWGGNFNGWTGPSVMRYDCLEGTGSNIAGSGVDASRVVSI